MDKFAERRKSAGSGRLIATAAAAMCLLGIGAVEAYASPAPQVVATTNASQTISGVVKDSQGTPIIGANVEGYDPRNRHGS